MSLVRRMGDLAQERSRDVCCLNGGRRLSERRTSGSGSRMRRDGGESRWLQCAGLSCPRRRGMRKEEAFRLRAALAGGEVAC